MRWGPVELDWSASAREKVKGMKQEERQATLESQTPQGTKEAWKVYRAGTKYTGAVLYYKIPPQAVNPRKQPLWVRRSFHAQGSSFVQTAPDLRQRQEQVTSPNYSL